MKCASIQTWLLQVESLHVKDWPRNMNRHLKKCAECAKLARQLYKLEEGWRNQPVPEECSQAKAAFLENLPKVEETTYPEKREKTARRKKRSRPAKVPMHRAGSYRWLAVAAVLFIGVILAGLVLPGKTHASSSDIVERLIDWNVEMTNADAKERKRLLEKHEGEFATDLLNATLSVEDRELAKELFEKTRELANIDDDPVAEAQIVKDIADKLFSHAEKAGDKGNEKDFERCGMRYMKYKEYGYDPMKNRMAEFKSPDPRKGGDKGGVDKGGFDKGGLKGGFEYQMNQKKLEKIFERPPEFNSRSDLKGKLEGFGKKGGMPGGKMGGRK